MASLSSQLKSFLANNSELEIKFNSLKPNQRRLIHQACKQFGVSSLSNKYNSKSKQKQKRKDMVLCKPKDWIHDTELVAKFISPLEEIENPKIQTNFKPVREIQCSDCNKELDDYTALYNFHCGRGYPMCQQCIDADEELSGHKWEPRE